MVSAAVLVALSFGPRWHTLYSPMFSMPPGPDNYVASVSWSAEGQKAMMIDLIEFPGDGTKQLRMSSKVRETVLRVKSVKVYSYDRPNFVDKQGRFNKVFAIPFLATEIESGKIDRTLVWAFDWHSLRPTLMLNVANADTSRLSKGIVVEKSSHRTRRTWRFDHDKVQFVLLKLARPTTSKALLVDYLS